MQWSNSSLLKESNVGKSSTAKSIVTKLPIAPVKKEKKIQIDERNSVRGLQEQQRLKIENEWQKIEKQKQQLLQEAQEEATRIKAEAHERGLQEGQQQGHQEGYQKGYSEGHAFGTEKASEETENILIQAKDSLREAMEMKKVYLQEKQQELLQFSVQMAQELIRTQLDFDDATILNIIEPILLKLEKPEQLLVVRANEKYHDLLVEKMETKKQEMPSMRYLVLKDATMDPYNLTVESEEALATFDLEEELHRFLQQLAKD
ncbi:FliH/SctL family protein [Enterococcus olivae]